MFFLNGEWWFSDDVIYFTMNDKCSEVITRGPEQCDNEEGRPQKPHN